MGDLKYKVGDKVRIKSIDWYNKNKDEDGDISCGEFDFVEGMKKFCSETFTISDDDGDCYLMLEDNYGYAWTDEMIECKLEEECPQDFIEKYCISCGTQRCDRTKEYLDGCPYYNEYMSIKQNNTVEDESKNTDDINRESYVKAESNEYFQEYMNSLCKEHDEMIEGLMKDGTIVDYVKESNDRYRIVIDPRFDIEVDEGEYYAVRRKKEYPKTFLGCCDVLGIEDLISRGVNGYRSELLDAFQKLLICRDAYWQIAGEEMELGKPWEPDWGNDDHESYPAIVTCGGKIIKSSIYTHDNPFAFPTEGMRDAFFNAFRDDIEKCKELI